MPVRDLIARRNRHLRLASFSYRAVSHRVTLALSVGVAGASYTRTKMWCTRADRHARRRISSPISTYRIVTARSYRRTQPTRVARRGRRCVCDEFVRLCRPSYRHRRWTHVTSRDSASVNPRANRAVKAHLTSRHVGDIIIVI